MAIEEARPRGRLGYQEAAVGWPEPEAAAQLRSDLIPAGRGLSILGILGFAHSSAAFEADLSLSLSLAL